MLNGVRSINGRWNVFSLLAVLLVGLSVVAFSGPGWAYQDAEDAVGEAGEEPEAPPADTVDDGSETTQPAPTGEPPESFLSWAIEASGFIGLLILLSSFVMVAVAFMVLLQARRDNFLPAAFIEAFEQKLNAKDYQGAYETARADDSFLARVLAAGLGRLNRGYEEAVEGMQEVGEDESMAIDHKLSYIALVASVAPMLGLMGTVKGMIDAFSVIANSPTQPAPKDLAKGISTALFTTLEGLIVAVPAIIIYGLLKNRIARLVLEVGMVSEGLMSRFSSKGKAGGAAPAPAPAKPAE
ncbi:MAG: MotA/TolQ/ExbB proton channel family protein [Planctomycetota bacterium]|nr:MAG: MotA/TolQ/ExbB proton channel family protein [Planctomycetota bacterium]REK28980.1 MAG: MotA/TolQ/ExbB proton channel family protein [Planctomycetota bacterium]REK39586.1 MAG: MotA/TolQ/ExbB proton channel family protein [Planctomycetota bacterium]